MNPHKSTNYKDIQIKNPFLEGQDKAYADLLQDACKDKNFWKHIVGPGALLLFFVSLAISLYTINRQQIVPVLVNVMPSGEAQYLGEVHQSANMQAPEAAIQWQIRKFITNLRSISTDPQVLYNNIDDCYSMVTSSYDPIMTRNLRANSPFAQVGKLRRSIEIESILKTTSSTYQIDWSEISTDTAGTKRTVKMRALATVKLLPTSEETMKRNPLGIYIENCEITEL